MQGCRHITIAGDMMKTFQTLGRAALITGLLMACSAGFAQDGVGKTSIVIGQSVALTGPAAPLASSFAQGARLFFDRVNAAGGINGRTIELVTLDDGGN